VGSFQEDRSALRHGISSAAKAFQGVGDLQVLRGEREDSGGIGDRIQRCGLDVERVTLHSVELKDQPAEERQRRQIRQRVICHNRNERIALLERQTDRLFQISAQAALADAIAQTRETLDELRALSRGIAPPILADRGLPAALAVLAARSTIPAEFDAGPLGQQLSQRLDPAVETAAYFVIAEALANAAKHSHARRCVIGLRHGHRTLRVWLTDDGVGGAALVKGHGLRGLDHRLHEVGGRLTVTSPAGGPTTVAAELPCC
jgi:signal transduction histidine kinase